MKRILPLILLILALAAVSACTQAEKDAGSQKDNSDDLQPQAGSGETASGYTPNLPDIKFDGYEFRALISTFNIFGPYTFAVENENGDTINDAVYGRNLYLEDKYGITLKQTEMDLGDLEALFKKSVTAGTDDFDVCMQIDRVGFNLGIQGYVLASENLPHLDLSQPWYPGEVNESVSVGGKNYLVFSDECLNMYGFNLAICFNKKLVRDLALDSPYELIENGKWTYDKFAEMCRAATLDIDGDGTMTDADRYGVLSRDGWLLSNFWLAAGIDTVTKDSNGVFLPNVIGNERLVNYMEKGRDILFGGPKIYFSHKEDTAKKFSINDSEYGFTNIAFQQFDSDLGLFFSTLVGTIPMMRSLDVEFGIIPFPKPDESQERYYTRNGGGFPLMVPSHDPNPERTSIIMEAIAAHSKNTTFPAYKETSLKTKNTRDNESAEMIDIIFENSFMGLGNVIFEDMADGMNYAITNAMRGKGDFASFFEKNEPKLQKVLDNVNSMAVGAD